METVKVGICEPDDFSVKAIGKLSDKCEVSLYSGGDLREFISDKTAIFVRLKYLITDELLCQAKSLRYICSPTTGLNHIRLSSDRYEVISLKGEYDFLSTVRATPEHIFGLSLALLRNYVHAFLNEDNTAFDRELYKGYELYGNTVGIIGMGRIGRILGQYYHAFGAKVYYYDIMSIEGVSAIKCDSVEELIRRSNIIILSANYTRENESMVGEQQFSLMKDKYFINAARGELVDEDALLKYLRTGWFKGAAIDVIANETQQSEFLDELLKLTDSNLIVTPHIGGATYSSMERTEEFIADKLMRKMFIG